MRWWLAIAVGGAGCPARRPEPPQVVIVPAPAPAAAAERSPLIGVLDSVGMLLTMPRERQHEEVAVLSASVARADLPTDRMRLALILALGHEEVRDTTRAHELLEGQAWDTAGYESLARFVLQLLEERTGRARDRLDASLALESERRAREELQERLDAIKDIEAELESRDLGGDSDGRRPDRVVSPEDPVR